MKIGLLITPQTLIFGAAAVTAVSGVLPLGYDIHETCHGHFPLSRVGKIFADIILITSFAVGIYAYANDRSIELTRAIIVYSAAVTLRLALSIFSKLRGEHTNL